MPRIIVKDTQVHERAFNKNGKDQIFRSQRAALDLGSGYELPFRIPLGTSAPHQVGDYDLDAESFQLNNYGDLALGRVKLRPFAAAAPSTARVVAPQTKVA